MKLNLDGTRNTNFTAPALISSTWSKPLGNGKIFVLDTGNRPKLMHPDGSLDPNFNTNNSAFCCTTLPVKTVTVGEDNKIYVAGSFSTFGGTSVGEIVRLQANGALDSSFYSAAPSFGDYFSAVYDARGYLHVTTGNSFDSLQGQAYGRGPYRLFAGVGLSPLGLWKSQFTFSPGLDGNDADADGDTIPNIFEFYFGSNPTNAASGTRPFATNVISGGLIYPAITFVRSQAASGVILTPRVSTGLTFGDSLGHVVEPVVDLGGGLERVTIRSTTNLNALRSQFLRIQLTAP